MAFFIHCALLSVIQKNEVVLNEAPKAAELEGTSNRG